MTPFADVKAGYAVGDIEGAYASIGVGVRFSLKGKKALNLALMYNFQDYDATTDYSYSYGGHYYHNSWNDTWELHGVGARFDLNSKSVCNTDKFLTLLLLFTN